VPGLHIICITDYNPLTGSVRSRDTLIGRIVNNIRLIHHNRNKPAKVDESLIATTVDVACRVFAAAV
jgi:hypothetical protein